MRRRLTLSVVSLLAVGVAGTVGMSPVAGASPASGASHGARVLGHVDVTSAVHHDVSKPLRDMVGTGTVSHAYPAKRGPLQRGSMVIRARDTSGAPAGAPRIPGPIVNFDGIAANGSAPPDNNGAPGLTQYVELVNQKYAVYSKTGTLQFGPVNTNTLWSGFGGGCQTNNDGDGMILWDAIAQRWVADQFSVSTTPFLMCVAVSTTTSATGSYNRYSFSYGTTFPDYPKMGVWPDAYYATLNLFNSSGTTALGTRVCAYDRAKMLLGQAATQQCFTPFTSGTHTYLPANFDGTIQPPAGAPNYMVGLASVANNLSYFKFHVDWANPANSTLTGPTNLAVTAYSQACGGGACIPQSGFTQKLDSLGDRVMNRLAYRNFGDHEALVVTHSITAGASVGARWYELRVNGGNLSVFQQGTVAPDAAFRWMGSIATDQAGDMALGYSISSSTTHPGIRYTGRLPGDPAGQMPQGEGTIFTGNGSQTGGLDRWGDYTQMSIDPSDDCTFWYVNEYIPANGSFNWHTRIGAFKFDSCGVTDDFSIAANPNSVTVYAGDSAQSTISTTVTKGNPQTVTLSASGLPTGATASFNPNPIQSGQSSTLTIDTTQATPPGTSTVTVTGTGTEATHSTTISLTVNPPDDFSMSADPDTMTLNAGDSGQSTIATTITHGVAQTVSLSVSGLPAGASGSFDQDPIQSGQSATLTISTSPSTPGGTYIVTVTGTGAEVTRTATISLTVNGTGSQLLGNPGFETGSAPPWVVSRASIINSAPAEPPHSGTWDAWLGGTGKKHKDKLYQQVTIPPGTSSASLTFFLHIDTAEGSGVFDTLKVQIRNTSNTVLKTLATYSNQDAGAGYTQKTFDVTQFANQTIRVFLLGKEDLSAQTSFVVDDFALTAQGPALTIRG
jgi:hypothetical protein